MTSTGYSEHPPTTAGHGPGGPGGPATLPDVLDRILDKGLVIAGDVTLQLLDVEILTIKVRLLLASAERAEEMGIDWWKHDPFLSGQAEQDRKLQQRVDKLENLLGSIGTETGGEAGSGRTSDRQGEGSADERDDRSTTDRG